VHDVETYTRPLCKIGAVFPAPQAQYLHRPCPTNNYLTEDHKNVTHRKCNYSQPINYNSLEGRKNNNL
jgi:hypothetical protein